MGERRLSCVWSQYTTTLLGPEPHTISAKWPESSETSMEFNPRERKRPWAQGLEIRHFGSLNFYSSRVWNIRLD